MCGMASSLNGQSFRGLSPALNEPPLLPESDDPFVLFWDFGRIDLMWFELTPRYPVLSLIVFFNELKLLSMAGMESNEP